MEGNSVQVYMFIIIEHITNELDLRNKDLFK